MSVCSNITLCVTQTLLQAKRVARVMAVRIRHPQNCASCVQKEISYLVEMTSVIGYVNEPLAVG